MNDHRLKDHPLLHGQTPGTTEYTQALRHLLPVITSGEDRDPLDLGRWQTLRDCHLKLVQPDLRNEHALALTPRALLGGFELSAYVAGLTVMTVLALSLLTLLPQMNETLALVLSVFLGMGTVALVNRRYEQLRQRALSRLGLLHVEDPANLTGSHL